MSTEENQFAWWNRLRHSGLLLSPVVQIEKYASFPDEPKWHQQEMVRTAYNRFLASIDRNQERPQLVQAKILAWVDDLLEKYIGHDEKQLSRSHSVPESLTAVIRIGSRTETLRPDRVLFDADGKTPLLLVKTDASSHIGRGKGRTEYARFLELLRGSGHRLGLLTNGLQFRLVYAGLDFESWCEWESERWFEDAEGAEELLGLRQVLFPKQIKDSRGEAVCAGLPGLLAAIEESRKRQADLSQVLRENVRQAVELLLEDVSNASRTDNELFNCLVSQPVKKGEKNQKQLTESETQEALLQATVRIVMRMVVCLFAESRGLLPVNDLIYSHAYGVRTLYELLDETVRHEGSQLGLMSRQSAWARLMALVRLIHGGSAHGNFALRPYGGTLFRPGESDSEDPVSRALFILEHKVSVNDATIFRVLRKLLRGPLPVLRGRSKTYVEGPVDYTELRTEFIGLIYEGLLDYRVKRTSEEIGPQVFLKLGRNPVLPLSILEQMLQEKPNQLKDLLDKLTKEKATTTVSSSEESEGDDEDIDEDSKRRESEDDSAEIVVERDSSETDGRSSNHLEAEQAARRWARAAIIKTKRIPAQTNKETDTEYDKRIEVAIGDLIEKVVAPGEFYLVRAGNTRKGTGTFYTRPQLAVPTAHRTLEPLCFDKDNTGALIPKKPEEILALKVCDPACGSASFLVAALHYLTNALYKSLCFHCGLDDPKRATKITLPYGKASTGKDAEATVPLPPDDPNRGDEFTERIQALLRRFVVERCIYGVDINPLAVEFARVSLWVETLDPELPFSFLDHKIKVGNSLVGCWLNRVQDYPIMAWSRLQRQSDQQGDLKEFSKAIKATRDETIKRLVREWVFSNGPQKRIQFTEESDSLESVHRSITDAFEQLHSLPMSAIGIGERESAFRQLVLSDARRQRLKLAMDTWCSIWFWPPQSIELCPLPADICTDLSHKPGTLNEVERLAAEHRFFHWELEFPDVFNEFRCGFDAVAGNPPWETSKASSLEFFTNHDPIYRTYGKQEAQRRQKQILSERGDICIEWRNYLAFFSSMINWVGYVSNPSGYHPRTTDGPSPFNLMDASSQWKKSDEYHARWNALRRQRVGFQPDNKQPFQLQGGADINLYKLFTELGIRLLNEHGRLGFIVPSSLYTDAETVSLRNELLDHSEWQWLFAFENRKRIFEIDGRFKFASIIVDRCKHGFAAIKAAFMIQDLSAWDSPSPPVFDFPKSLVKLFSPNSKAIVEVRTKRDLAICEQIYSTSVRIGESSSGWEFDYGRELEMTSDSKLFPPKPRWEEEGYRCDNFGFWQCNGLPAGIPLYEGRMVGQFDFSEKGWISGKGRSATWRSIPFDAKQWEPQFLLSSEDYASSGQIRKHMKFAVMRVSSSTNERTVISSIVPEFPAQHSLFTGTVTSYPFIGSILATAFFNSFVFDFVVRQRCAGNNVTATILNESPLPPWHSISERVRQKLVVNTARLTFLHRRFAPEWCVLREVLNLSGTEWKQLWAVTPADRLRMRTEIEALSASLFALSESDFEWLVRNDTEDPKGFFRVDEALPYEERLTGLSARAFRALKEGKWSAETVEQLSNDEFFTLLGIPELTNADAAKAKGLPGSLILKRQGCHSWHPENFPADDPRHGWTWEDCRKDAITLLGSEEALEAYIAQATATGEEADDEDEEPDPNHSGPKDLFGNPIPTDLFGKELRPKKKRSG